VVCCQTPSNLNEHKSLFAGLDPKQNGEVDEI
jgi:hypothetical protein